MPFNIGAPELIVILVIALLVIGPGKLPDVGSALGKSIREFRKASSDVQDATKIDASPSQPAQPAPQSPPPPPSSEPTTESNR
jgi:sec-independent protein translocase protein TatA